DMSPGIGIPATSRPGNPEFVPGYSGKCCSVNRDFPQMNQETASEGTKGQSITAIEAVLVSFLIRKRVYDTILGRASMKIIKEPSRSYYKKGRWRSIKNQKDNPELVKPALSVAPPKPTSNSDEDANADQVKLEDVALESGDISTLNSLVGNGSPQTLQLCGTIGLGNIHVLIDNESTYNFVQSGVLERMKQAVSITKPFKVYIGSGETLLYENICSKVGINMQGIAIEVDLVSKKIKKIKKFIAIAELDENKSLLKDQVAARKQQFDAFQEHMAALQAELQATKGLIRAGSYGCGGVTASPIPCSMRFDVPKFSGTDPDRWIFSITRYFPLLSAPVDQRLRVDGFLESVRHRFGPCKYEDPQGAFSELLQKGTVAQYQGDQEVSLVSNTTIVNSGGGQNQKDNPELVKPALSAVPPKPISNSDEDTDADQVKLEDVALESGDISTLNSLVGNESPQTLQLCGTIGLELDENKLLLKDQVAARKQQFDAFQEDMAALQAELQVTKGLIQAGSYGCGGETASPIPCSMRFDVPKFSGIDPDRWIFSITGYFPLLSAPIDQRLRVDGFLESVRHRFGPCKFEDPQGAFSELLHKGTVAQYQEACLGDQQVSLVSNTTIVNSGGGQNQKDNPELVKPALSAAPPKPISNSDEDADADQLKLEDVSLESRDISTLNSLVGNGSPRTLQLCRTIDLGNTHVLIDNDSTHNFVQPGVVERMKLAVSITKPFKVYIGSGETLLYENICSKVGINMQGIAMELNKGRERTLDPQEVLTNMKGWKIEIRRGVKNNGRGRVDKIYRPRDSNKILRSLPEVRKFIEENSYQRRASDNGEGKGRGKGSSQDPNVNFSLSSAELFQHPDVNLSSLGGDLFQDPNVNISSSGGELLRDLNVNFSSPGGELFQGPHSSGGELFHHPNFNVSSSGGELFQDRNANLSSSGGESFQHSNVDIFSSGGEILQHQLPCMNPESRFYLHVYACMIDWCRQQPQVLGSRRGSNPGTGRSMLAGLASSSSVAPTCNPNPKSHRTR
nr:major facilitator, sugar transporter-like, major facilitator superfamily domain protein [Tanacetum cinerariifolium]